MSPGGGFSRRIPLPDVVAAVSVERAQLDVAEAGGLTATQAAAARTARASLDAAERAAQGKETSWNRVSDWWNGYIVETAYRQLHAARVQLVNVYDRPDVDAEIPRAVARAQNCFQVDDPRRLALSSFEGKDLQTRRAMLKRLVEAGYEDADEKFKRVRSFRNITLLAAAGLVLVVVWTVVVIARDPALMPFCFQKSPGPGVPTGALSCPSSAEAFGPQATDIQIVALAGLIGGAFSAAYSLRTLRGTSSPYDAPVALAVLKPPFGALTAIVGLLLIQGGFVPGLSDLDSQGQIVAYALLFGVAQQAFTRFVDQKAQSILDGLPAKDAEALARRPSPPATAPGVQPAPATTSAGTASASLDGGSVDATEPEPAPRPASALPAPR